MRKQTVALLVTFAFGLGVLSGVSLEAAPAPTIPVVSPVPQPDELAARHEALMTEIKKVEPKHDSLLAAMVTAEFLKNVATGKLDVLFFTDYLEGVFAEVRKEESGKCPCKEEKKD